MHPVARFCPHVTLACDSVVRVDARLAHRILQEYISALKVQGVEYPGWVKSTSGEQTQATGTKARKPKTGASIGRSRRHPSKALTKPTLEEENRMNTVGNGENQEGGPDRIAKLGDRLYRRHAAQLEQQYFGQYVIFNIASGKYVIGASHLEAVKAYRDEHGHAPGWCQGIGLFEPCLTVRLSRC
jgi:hypothetical protein